jgi:hypothetical protein
LISWDNVDVLGLIKIKVIFDIEQPMKAQKGSRGIALLFL